MTNDQSQMTNGGVTALGGGGRSCRVRIRARVEHWPSSPRDAGVGRGPGRGVRSKGTSSPRPSPPSSWRRGRSRNFVAPGWLLIIAFVLSVVRLPAQELFVEQSALSPKLIDGMYVKGLQYLVRTQSPDGNWPDSYGQQPAVVGLAIVAMLAHGDDPNLGSYHQTIRKGLDFILRNQDGQTGYIGPSMYNHGFATLALAEAYGAVADSRLGPALQKAVELIVMSQKKNPKGGWRYSPDGNDADTTVSGAQMVALYAARNAGLFVPEEAIERGLHYFSSCKTSDGGYGYTSASGANSARTAIGCLVLALAKKKDSPEFKSAFAYIEKAPPEGHYYQYYLYYAAQAFFHASPVAWRSWNLKNIQSLAATQSKTGAWEGPFGHTFGTSTSLLSLALNYRYLPIYER